MRRAVNEKKVCLYFCALFCFLVCFSSCKTEIIKYLPAEEKEDSTVVMITWKGSFASADEIENPEYLWAYYNTTDGCSYVYDGEKWTLLASGNSNTSNGVNSVFLMYNLDGGKFTERAPLVYTYGTVLELLSKPVKPDYVFTGWTYDGKPITQINDSFIYGKEITATWIKVSELFKQKNLTITESQTLKFADIFADINDDNVEITDFSFLRDFLVNLYETTPEIKIELDLTGLRGSIPDESFSGLGNLTSVTIPDGVISLEDEIFYGCTSLVSITIPDSVTSIGDGAFYGCTSLTSITIPDSVTSIVEAAFANCTSLTSITIPDSVTSIGTEYKSFEKIKVGAFENCTSLKNITIGNSVTDIGYYAFSKCESLTDITIPDSVTNIGWDAFSGCTSLKNITIGNSVTDIGYYAFSGCTSLTSITIPDSVTSLGCEIFSGCTSLTKLTIGNGVRGLSNSILWGDWGSLQEITIPFVGYVPRATAPSSYTIFGSIFGGHDLREVSFLISSGNEAHAFYPVNLKKVTVTGGNILNKAFSFCPMETIVLADGVTGFEEFTFYGCENLKSITIPDSVTDIGDYAFGSCTSLTSITIPDSVTSIGRSAFEYCKSLTTVNYTGTQEQWNEITIDSNNSCLTNATINYNYSGD